MEPGVLPELEELTLCSFCKQKFNDSDLCPKFLSCKHYFCLKCIQTALMKGRELYCVHCWKRTELGEQGADTLQTYGAVLTLAKNFTALKIGPGAGGGNKPPDKDRKVDNIQIYAHIFSILSIYDLLFKPVAESVPVPPHLHHFVFLLLVLCMLSH